MNEKNINFTIFKISVWPENNAPKIKKHINDLH
jgi:hypothetical protein